MYKDLPNQLQERIKKCLMANDFPKAKALHDAWLARSRGPAVGRRVIA